MTRGATQELIGPSCEVIASKWKYFNSCRLKRATENVSPQTQRVFTSTLHGISLPKKNRVAFGVNTALGNTSCNVDI